MDAGWGCGSVGRAFAWHALSPGSDPQQVWWCTPVIPGESEVWGQRDYTVSKGQLGQEMKGGLGNLCIAL